MYVIKAVPQDKSLPSSSHLKTTFRGKPSKLYLQYSLTRGYLCWYSFVQWVFKLFSSHWFELHCAVISFALFL